MNANVYVNALKSKHTRTTLHDPNTFDQIPYMQEAMLQKYEEDKLQKKAKICIKKA